MGDLVINEIAQKLVNGTRGDMAMQELRDRGYRLSSLNSISSRIRSAVLASCEPPDYSTLQAPGCIGAHRYRLPRHVQVGSAVGAAVCRQRERVRAVERRRQAGSTSPALPTRQHGQLQADTGRVC